MPENLAIELENGLRQMGIDPEQLDCDVYLRYVEILARWNQRYNLVAPATPVEILHRHVFDALSIAQFIRGERCLDIGTGAGLPGFVLALANPRCYWVLLDSLGKRIRFLRQAILELQTDNIELAHTRIEDFDSATLFSTITSRAFSSLPVFYHCAHHHLAEGGVLLAMKGRNLGAEYCKLPVHVKVVLHPISSPARSEPYTLVELSQ